MKTINYTIDQKWIQIENNILHYLSKWIIPMNSYTYQIMHQHVISVVYRKSLIWTKPIGWEFSEVPRFIKQSSRTFQFFDNAGEEKAIGLLGKSDEKIKEICAFSLNDE